MICIKYAVSALDNAEPVKFPLGEFKLIITAKIGQFRPKTIPNFGRLQWKKILLKKILNREP